MKRTDKRRTGDLGEGIACTYLESKGFKIVERNYLKPWGEIDIIAVLNGVYRFVEVKTISREKQQGGGGVSAEDHIHPAKLKRLARTIELYVANIKGDPEYQLDVLTVTLDHATRRAHCKLYEQVL